MTAVKVAAGHAALVLADRDTTIARVVSLAGQAARRRATLVVFPEAFVLRAPGLAWCCRPWEAPFAELLLRPTRRADLLGEAGRRPGEKQDQIEWQSPLARAQLVSNACTGHVLAESAIRGSL
jgi:hypothetical protein